MASKKVYLIKMYFQVVIKMHAHFNIIGQHVIDNMRGNGYLKNAVVQAFID
jgi:hypothetical protein